MQGFETVRTWTVSGLALFCLLFMLPSRADGAAQEAAKALSQSVDMEQKAMDEGDAWARKETELRQDIQQASLQSAWYELHIKTLQRYIQTAKDNVVELEQTKLTLEQLERALESALIEEVKILKEFVHKDMPFLMQEREQRLSFLNDSLNDYTVSLSEKLRRVFEALQVENAYATDIEVSRETIQATDGNYAADIIRIGRVGLFALSPDSTRAWQYSAQGYIPLPQEFIAGLHSIVQENIQGLVLLPFENAGSYGVQK